LPAEQRIAVTQALVPAHAESEKARDAFAKTLRDGGEAAGRAAERNRQAAADLAWLSFWDILVFFGVLLVGYAYLWKRGDLDWVRSTAAEEELPEPASAETESKVLVGVGGREPYSP